MATETTTQTAEAPQNGKRKKGLIIAAAIFATLGVIYGAYWLLDARFYQDTDDAYVAGNVVQVTPQIVGTVVAIKADDTYFVNAGDDLVLLDKADAKVALEQTEAALGQTVRQVRSLFTTNASLAANVELAQSQVSKAQADLKRRRSLTDTGAVSYEELNHAENALTGAQADLLAAKEKLASNKAFTDNTDIDNHPNVKQAAAKVHEAYLAFQRAAVPAPVSGFIAKRSVQVGQRVAPGNPLMAIIPLEQVWVDANFKEGQLARMRIGQAVTIKADIYGGKVTYHGKVVGLSAGTGSAFSLLPAQNATGNWIKVVQRVPVKIQLDPQELKEHPLRIGLSIVAEVNIKDQSGQQLAAAQPSAPVYQTAVYTKLDHEADALVRKIIAANRGTSVDEGKPNTAPKKQSSIARQATHSHSVAIAQ
ncbi:MAG TPA: efflux RND transporter periplasmic adaptor subunit [Spongiibacteraceae bacterium]|nr:efflux RND transporter periplasmic adaptor subunit [Spongiibacteraceae bacterium]